ncbi:MAG: hypothetical protein U1E65_36455 [Myxococcota bacterium]
MRSLIPLFPIALCVACSSGTEGVDASANDAGQTDGGAGHDAAEILDGNSPTPDTGTTDGGADAGPAGDGAVIDPGIPILERTPRIAKTCSVSRGLIDHAPRYFTSRSALIGTANGFFVARGEHGGTPFGVDPVSFVLSSLALDGSFGASTDLGGDEASSNPVAAPDGAGFALVWVQSDHLRFQRFDAAGAANGAAHDITSPAVSASISPRLIARSGGGFLLAYTTQTPPRVELLLLDGDGAPVGNPIPLLSSFDYYDHALSLLQTDAGFAVFYRTKSSGTALTSDVYVARLDASAHPQGTPAKLSTTSGPEQSAGGGQMFGAPRISALRIGDQYLAAWAESETRTVGGNPIGWSRILVQRLNLQLEPSGAPVRLGREVDNVNAEEPALYAKDGQVAVFWTEGQEIYICGGCFPDNSLHLVWIDPTDLVPSSAPLVVPPLAGGITDEQAAFLGDSILVTADLRFHVHSEPGSLALRCR